jgi:hypothetical protein
LHKSLVQLKYMVDIREGIFLSVEWAAFFDATKIIDSVSKKVLIDKMHIDWIIKGHTPALHFLATLSGGPALATQLKLRHSL